MHILHPVGPQITQGSYILPEVENITVIFFYYCISGTIFYFDARLFKSEEDRPGHFLFELFFVIQIISLYGLQNLKFPMGS